MSEQLMNDFEIVKARLGEYKEKMFIQVLHLTEDLDMDKKRGIDNFSIDECQIITEWLNRFLEDLFAEVNFSLYQINFNANWRYRVGETKREAMKPKEKVTSINDLISQLTSEEREQLSKKLGGQ